MSLVISDTSSCSAGGRVIRTGFYVDSPAALSVTVATVDGALNLVAIGIIRIAVVVVWIAILVIR